jgi:hypothetical protein
MTMRDILVAMAHQSHVSTPSQLLQKPQRKFLPMILNKLIRLVESSTTLKQLTPIPPSKIRPSNPAGLKRVQQGLAGAQICHPLVIPRFWKTSTAKSCR